MLNYRIKQLRKALGLSQIEFGENIGAHHSSVSEWENGKVEIKESSINLIELRYNVNSKWLREGEGEMFLPAISPLEPFIEWIKTLQPDKKIWLKIELEEKIPQYKNWLADKR